METWIVIAILTVITVLIVLLFKGAWKTFVRQPIAAAIFMVFATPIWIMWAIIEMFTEDI